MSGEVSGERRDETSVDPSLVFVYKADAGLFNAMADAAHKIFSPETYGCRLCLLTYGWLRESAQWRQFVASLPVACEFLHRDELARRFPGLAVELPAVLRLVEGRPLPCLDAEALGRCASLAELMDLVRTRCLGG